MSKVNDLKVKALDIAYQELFSYVAKEADERYAALAKENACLQGNTCEFFFFDGEVYPRHSSNGTPVYGANVRSAPLHYSLLPQFDQIQATLRSTHRSEIRNYLGAVLNCSINGIVLDTMLPPVIISKLRSSFTKFEYDLINLGENCLNPADWEPIEVTKKNMKDIEEHYAETITTLRMLLMEKLFLE